MATESGEEETKRHGNTQDVPIYPWTKDKILPMAFTDSLADLLCINSGTASRLATSCCPNDTQAEYMYKWWWRPQDQGGTNASKTGAGFAAAVFRVRFYQGLMARGGRK